VLIDCDTCVVRGPACGDCMVTVLLQAPPDGVDLDETEQAALHALAEGGLVPRLRLVPAAGSRPAGPERAPGHAWAEGGAGGEAGGAAASAAG